MVGQTILHYKILEKLGEGGMGVVYKANDTKLNRIVALKFLPSHLHLNEEAEKRFISEAKAASSFDHPNICTIFDINKTDDDQLYIAMAYYEGETLKKILENGPLKIEKVVDFCINIAQGLQRAHEESITHRDIKPANIFITIDGTAKILDFGLAKVNSQTQMTTMGTTMGTVAYMSPEQTKGEAVDHRTDIWSFGVVLYEMLASQLPFKGDYEQAIIYSILNEEPEPITGLRSGVPMELELIVNKTLAKNPDERYQQIEELLVDLRILKKNLSSPIKDRFTITRRLNEQKRNKWKDLFPWITTIIAIGAAIVLWILWQATPPPERPLMRFVYNLPLGYLIEDAEFFGSAVTLSPDGSYLVYTAADTTGVTKLYLRPIDQFESTPLPGTEDASNPFFSPDGQWVGFFAGGKLKKISLKGGTPLNICEAQTGFGASWGDDNTIVFSPEFTSGLLKVSATGGTPKALTSLNSDKGEISHRWPEILPDGKSVLFTINTGMDGDVKHIAVYSLASGEQRILIKEGTFARYVPTGYLLYMRSGSLMAAPFDIEQLEITGSSIKVLDGVKYSGAGGGQYSISSNGLLAWIPALELTSFTSEFSSPVSFRRVAKGSLLWVDRQGNTEPIKTPSRGYWAPQFSPDGTRLALTIELDIFILELSRGSLTRLTFEGRNHIPVWTPDGKRITFSSARRGHPNIFWKMADGSGDAERLLTSKQHQDPGSWSPDGKTLAYAELHPETNWDIWLLLLENKNQSKPFLQTIFNEYHPMISPDGHWLAYTSDESGQPEVYVRSFPAGHGKWPISTEGGQEPLWARDGSELFYRNSGKLMAVTIETESTFLAGRPKLLFEREYAKREMNPFGSPNFDVSSDGRFLIIEPDSMASSTEINFALNWFEELERLVPNKK